MNVVTDDLPSAEQLRAEIEAMPTARLQEVARTGAWPIHPLRTRLDTAERRAAAREAVADLERDRASDAWRELAATDEDGVRSAITARRLEALARAWERLGGGREFLFHVRGERRAGENLQLDRLRLAAPTLALDPNPGVPPAPCLEHPISLAEAARFAVVLPVMRRCAALGEAAARAFDVLGQPTAAQHRRAALQTEPPRRRAVWRLRSAARSARSKLHMALHASWHVLEGLGSDAAPERFGVPAVVLNPGSWSETTTMAIGALAWRIACERDARVQSPRASMGPRMFASPAVVGRRYRELDDPFTPLLAVLRLGCRLHAFSREAATFELHPL